VSILGDVFSEIISPKVALQHKKEGLILTESHISNSLKQSISLKAFISLCLFNKFLNYDAVTVCFSWFFLAGWGWGYINMYAKDSGR